MFIVKVVGLLVVMVLSQFILHAPHYMIANWYDVNINAVLLIMFWYGCFIWDGNNGRHQQMQWYKLPNEGILLSFYSYCK